MIGVYLDTAWHRTVGRDSFFIPPHVFIYGGGLGVWGAALAAIARATSGGDALFGRPLARLGRLHLPFGFAVAALGIIVVMAAGPVDAWWHATFGKDVLIWSPPHLLLHLGAAIGAIGLLFAVAAQHGRGALARPWLWRGAMLAVLVDLVHRGHFVLAHYTMLPHARTPDLYPFLVALLVPVVLVAAARALGSWAPTLACLLFLGVAWLMDVMLRLIDFERYTLTPILAVPAAVLSLVFRGAERSGGGRQRERAWLAAAAGAAFALAFVAMETAWMRSAVGRPWAWERVLAALPRVVVTGALSGWVGWVLGGFLRAVVSPRGAVAEFAGPVRARAAALAATLLAVVGLAATYQPQRYGPPMTAGELRLAPLARFPYQEAIFWNAVLAPGWPLASRIEARSEGIIDGVAMPVGPAWCAPTDAALSTALAGLRFTMEFNGAPVDLGPYPLVRLGLRDGAHCAWVGVASGFQRASRNRFVYTIERRSLDGPVTTRVELHAVFKDP